MAVKDISELTGTEKAGILLLALGTSISAEVFKHLTEDEIQRLSAQLMRVNDVESVLVQAVVAEFEQVCSVGETTVSGGKTFAAEVLAQAVGQEKADQYMDKAGGPDFSRPFECLWALEASRLAKILSQEHPQVIAVVLTYLPSEKAAAIMTEIPEDVKADVALRICVMGEVDPAVLTAIEEVIQTKLEVTSTQVVVESGPKVLVDILNNAERSTERAILDGLLDQDPELAEQVRGMIFVFEDLPKLEDRAVQLILREVEQEDLRMALKGSDDVIKALVFRNMSERAAEMLKEDLELLTNAKDKDIEAAQQKIVLVTRRLLASGEASLISEEIAEGTGGESEGEGGEDGNAEWEAMMKAAEAEAAGESAGEKPAEEASGDEPDQVDRAA
jgi:flagellar motor switch protein FliG